MAYSCTDFVDTILELLGIDATRETMDDPLSQAELAQAEIIKYQDVLRRTRKHLLEREASSDLEDNLADALIAGEIEALTGFSQLPLDQDKVRARQRV